MKCKAFLIALVAKLLEKAPIIYPLVRAVSCLDPRVFVSSDLKTLKASLRNILDCLVGADRLQECSEFELFVTDVLRHRTLNHLTHLWTEWISFSMMYYQRMPDSGNSRNEAGLPHDSGKA